MTAERPSGELEFEIFEGSALEGEALEGMSAVLVAAFDRWPTLDAPRGVREHLRWKVGGPAGWNADVILGRTDGQVAVVSASLGQRYLVRGVERSCRLGADSAVHPGFQGRGFDSARRAFMVRTLEPKHDLSLSFSGNPKIVQGGQRYGEAELGEPIEVLYRTLDLGASARTLSARRSPRLPSVAWRVALLGRRALDRLRHRPVRAAAVPIRTIEAFDERVEGFMAAAAAPFDFILLRDREYLNWRYCDDRAGPYRARVAEVDGELLGFAVTRRSGDRGYLVDLLALPGREDVVAALVRDASEQLRAEGVSGIDCWVPRHHSYHAVLRGAGFMPTPRQAGFALRGTVRDEVGDAAYLQGRGAAIHVMMGDSDFI